MKNTSAEAEQAILGGILLDNRALDRVVDVIDVNDFQRESHRIIFAAMKAMSRDIDYLTLEDKLKEQKQLDRAGGDKYIENLTMITPTTAHIEKYAQIVSEQAIIRRICLVATEIIHEANSGVDNLNQFIDDAERKLMAATQKRHYNAPKLIKELISEIFNDIEENKHEVGIPTGFVNLDRIITGLANDDLVILAARPSMGKTSLALNICQQCAATTLFVSLEMGNRALADRVLCSDACVDSRRLRGGKLTEDEWDRLANAASTNASRLLYVHDCDFKVSAIRSTSRRLQSALIKQEQQLGLIVVDYLQLMQGEVRMASREREVSENCRALKKLAMELHLPVLVLSQLSRKPESRDDKRPRLSDLRESGAIEQDADLVMLMYRDDYYHADTDDPGVTEIIIDKHRNGPTGTAKLMFHSLHTKFEDYFDEAKGYY